VVSTKLSFDNTERFSLGKLLSRDSLSGTRQLAFGFEIYIRSTNSIIPKPYQYDVDSLGIKGFHTKSIKK